MYVSANIYYIIAMRSRHVPVSLKPTLVYVTLYKLFEVLFRMYNEDCLR